MHHGPVQIHEISVEMLSTNFVTIRMSELSYMGISSPHCSYSQCTTHIGMCINSSLSSMTLNPSADE